MPATLRMREEEESVPWWCRDTPRDQNEARETIAKLGLSADGRWRHPAEVPLDACTVRYIRRRLQPVQTHVESIGDVMQHARERLADTRRFLRQAKQRRDSVVDKLRNIVRQPDDWFVQVCRKGVMVRLKRTFPETAPCNKERTTFLENDPDQKVEIFSETASSDETKRTFSGTASRNETKRLLISDISTSREIRAEARKRLLLQFAIDENVMPPTLIVREVTVVENEGKVQSQFGVKEKDDWLEPTEGEACSNRSGTDCENLQGKTPPSVQPAVSSGAHSVWSFLRYRDSPTNRSSCGRWHYPDYDSSSEAPASSVSTSFAGVSDEQITTVSKRRARPSQRNVSAESSKGIFREDAEDEAVVVSCSRGAVGDTTSLATQFDSLHFSVESSSSSSSSSSDGAASQGDKPRADDVGDKTSSSSRLSTSGGKSDADAAAARFIVDVGTSAGRSWDKDPDEWSSVEAGRIRTSQKAVVTETSPQRVCVKGHFAPTPSDVTVPFTVFVYREVADDGHEGGVTLRGSYARQMRTTDKNLRWRFSQRLDE